MTASAPAKPARLLSLDVFRGLAMASMVLVNDPGDWGHIYPPLEHSKWDGCTPTDLIFPFFLFMVGVSIVYAMESKKAAVANHGQIILHAFRRMVTLIFITLLVQLFYHPFPGTVQCLGLVVLVCGLVYVNTVGNTAVWAGALAVIAAIAFFFYHPGLATLRFPGVLQRIAVVYFISTLLYLKTSAKTRAWLFGGALISYYIIMCFIPVPGVGYANLNPETNMGAWVDRTIIGVNHLWAESHTWDPEGLLGTIPAIATCLFGMRVGSWLKRPDVENGTKVSWMFVYGIGAVVLALFWDLFFPINKALWTSSFVLYTGGLGTITLAFLYWIIDVKGYKRFTTFFVVYGMNAITAYIMADFVPGLIALINLKLKGQTVNGYGFIYQTLFVPYFSPVNASLAGAIWLVLLIWVLLWFLYIRKIIIKV